VREADDEEGDERRDRRHEPGRQEGLAAWSGVLEGGLEDLGGAERDGLVGGGGQGGAHGRNFGITSAANSRRLSRTACCGTSSIALSMKLMPSMPTESHRSISAMIRAGSPIATPSG